MKTLKIVLPIVVLIGGVLAAATLVSLRPEAETRIPQPIVPLVRAQTVDIRDLQVSVDTQGTVEPGTASVLVAEVAGRVLEVSPSFAEGGFFAEGQTLLRIDPIDYREAVVRARGSVVQAEVRLEQETAEAVIAREEWAELGGGEDPSPLTTRELQMREAQAALEVAEAALARAERDLARTEVRAPYAGIVRRTAVDLGQFVGTGQQLGEIYAIDRAEIRLPLPDDELAFLELPYTYRDGATRRGPAVTVSADFAGRTFQWTGRIVRTEGEIDPRSRLVHAVAEVADPYARGDDPDRPPLAAGMFVRATIEGVRLESVARLPRQALREDGRVLIVDDDDRLRFREVDVLRREQDSLIVRGDLSEGERLCVSALAVVTDGMQVRVADGESDDSPTGTGVAAVAPGA